jgi:DNA-binding NarL/FixJ family response regulator
VIRVLVVHEHRLIGDIIATVFQDQSGLRVIGYAATMEDALDFLEKWSCDVVLASVTLPDNTALRLARIVTHKNDGVKVLVTDMINSKAAILHCIEEGAAGYVYEKESLTNLVEKLHALYNNEFPVPPPIAAGLIARITELKRMNDTESVQHLTHRRSQCEDLTAREREVLNLMAIGSSNQEIAETLVIEVGTVKNHVHNIFRKLDIQSREHATFFAQQLA